MSPRSRRLIAAGIVVAVVAAVLAASRPGETPTASFRVVLGLKDKQPADWSGQVAVADGEAVELKGWRFEEMDAVQGATKWTCKTRNYITPGDHFPLDPASGKPAPPPQEPWPNGVVLTVRGADPAVTLTLAAGEVKFKGGDVPLGQPKSFLDGQVRVERLPATDVLRPAAKPMDPAPVQDDYPAFWVRYKTGKQYLAWVAYQKEHDRVLLAERDGPDGAWSEPMEVAGPGDHFRVALAGTHNDTLWVVWSSQRDHNWDLHGRPYKDGKLGDEVRLTDDPGPDIWHRMTTDQRGRAWLVWQGARDGKFAVFARCADGDGWHKPVYVGESKKADEWNPVVAADYKEDRVWVAWDSYESGAYNVQLRSLSNGPDPKLGELRPPQNSPLFQAHPSLACDRDGRLWVAWDEAGPNWGKDYGFLYFKAGGERLYASRAVRVRCLIDGQWKEPEADLYSVLSDDMKEYDELPQLQDDGEGRIWMAFRHRTCRHPRIDGWSTQGRWDVFAAAWLGDRWTTPVELPASGGRNDMRVDSQRDPKGNVYFACASDNRGWTPPAMMARNLSVAVSRLGGLPRPAEAKFRDPPPAAVPVAPVHPQEKEQVARVRGYKIDVGGKTYRVYRGDLHRHTDISGDGVGDGSLMDLHRYALDAAAFDFCIVSDHNMGDNAEYPWWRTQKANDLYTIPGSFISVYGYERSVPYPDGHRNVLWLERGHRTLPLPKPLPKAMAEDTQHLYEYLKETDGICTPHTSATDQGTNWAEHDDALEPVVEIFQGYHTSYEAPGAPRTVDDKTDRVHGPYKPDGFVSLALDKGYRLGFQASSDHISTHVSYSCVLAEEFSRKGLIDAIKKRHTYAATDNIVLDVRMGALGIMGDEVRTDKPGLDVVALGTSPIDRVDVIRDGEVVHSETPAAAEARFHWDDPKPKGGEKASYYYVRVLQKDGQAAWASPIWVTAK